MEPTSPSSVWWRGAMRGALQGIPLGIGVGLASAVLLSFVVLPLVPSLAPVFGSFLTMPGMGGMFLPLPLILFNTAITAAANFFTGGNLAVTQHRQQLDHAMNETRIQQLEAQVQAHNPAPSRAVEAILARGPHASHQQAEQERHESRTAPTLH